MLEKSAGESSPVTPSPSTTRTTSSTGSTTSGAGASEAGGSPGGLYLDSSGLVHPIAVLTSIASDCDDAVVELAVTYLGGALCMGDPDVESAWSAFHTAWTSELQVAASAQHQLAKQVPATLKAMQNADKDSSRLIAKSDIGTAGVVGSDSNAAGSGTGSGSSSFGSSSGGATDSPKTSSPQTGAPTTGALHGRVRAE